MFAWMVVVSLVHLSSGSKSRISVRSILLIMRIRSVSGRRKEIELHVNVSVSAQ